MRGRRGRQPISLETKSGGCADVVIVCALDMWELSIHVSFWFVADHGEHESYGMVDTLDIHVGARVVRAGDNRIGAEAVVEGKGRFGDSPESFVGNTSDGASPKSHISIDKEDVSRAGGGELSLCSGVQVGAALKWCVQRRK